VSKRIVNTSPDEIDFDQAFASVETNVNIILVVGQRQKLINGFLSRLEGHGMIDILFLIELAVVDTIGAVHVALVCDR
jgi:hypothetical protein